MPDERSGLSRRDVLRRSALVGGAVLWSSPAVQVLSMTEAHAAVPSVPRSITLPDLVVLLTVIKNIPGAPAGSCLALFYSGRSAAWVADARSVPGVTGGSAPAQGTVHWLNGDGLSHINVGPRPAGGALLQVSRTYFEPVTNRLSPSAPFTAYAWSAGQVMMPSYISGAPSGTPSDTATAGLERFDTYAFTA